MLAGQITLQAPLKEGCYIYVVALYVTTVSASVFFSPVLHTLLWKAAQYSIAGI
jgi:hypothetical protein